MEAQPAWPASGPRIGTASELFRGRRPAEGISLTGCPTRAQKKPARGGKHDKESESFCEADGLESPRPQKFAAGGGPGPRTSSRLWATQGDRGHSGTGQRLDVACGGSQSCAPGSRGRQLRQSRFTKCARTRSMDGSSRRIPTELAIPPRASAYKLVLKHVTGACFGKLS